MLMCVAAMLMQAVQLVREHEVKTDAPLMRELERSFRFAAAAAPTAERDTDRLR
jgi:hypothetical protein